MVLEYNKRVIKARDRGHNCDVGTESIERITVANGTSSCKMMKSVANYCGQN